MKNLNPKTYIVSAQSKDRNLHENVALHNYYVQLARVQGLFFKEVEGFFEGQGEDSLVLVGDDAKTLAFVNRIMLETNQKSALLLENDRTAYFIEAKDLGKDSALLQPAGHFTTVSEFEAHQSKGYTFDPKSNQYWIVR